ncbi:MAG: 3-hydroxybutyrate dehydrogenase [Ktedonobacterales bacterium]
MANTAKFAELDGKVALVTGAASGIGLAIAQALAEQGLQVMISDIDAVRGQEAANRLNGARFFAADLGDPLSCPALVQQVQATVGPVDVLVNNAGLQHVSSIVEFPETRWRQMIEIMLTAPFLLTQQVLPGMTLRRWGRIINMGSVHSLRASAYKSAYVAAKHGLLGLTRVTAIEGAPYGITCNAICPSYVRTPLVEKQISDQARIHNIPESEVVETIMVSEAPLHRLLEPEEVAASVIFLCSNSASAITGSAYTIDGGWTAH